MAHSIAQSLAQVLSLFLILPLSMAAALMDLSFQVAYPSCPLDALLHVSSSAPPPLLELPIEVGLHPGPLDYLNDITLTVESANTPNRSSSAYTATLPTNTYHDKLDLIGESIVVPPLAAPGVPKAVLITSLSLFLTKFSEPVTEVSIHDPGFIAVAVGLGLLSGGMAWL